MKMDSPRLLERKGDLKVLRIYCFGIYDFMI